MRLTNLLGGTALAMTAAAAAGAISAQELPACEGCADSMTIVSWGGAYSNSQNKAYHEPYQALTGIEIVNDESSAEAVAKLRAMEEAGTVEDAKAIRAAIPQALSKVATNHNPY